LLNKICITCYIKTACRQCVVLPN